MMSGGGDDEGLLSFVEQLANGGLRQPEKLAIVAMSPQHRSGRRLDVSLSNAALKGICKRWLGRAATSQGAPGGAGACGE